jgi:formamidopyrimidine-DNA glycosylase
MPEGPEVEVVRLGLRDIIGQTISKIKISDNRKYVTQTKQLQKLRNAKINKIERKGKFLLSYYYAFLELD